MANFNKVMLMGNLTKDPDLKYTPSGAAVCEFGLAVNRSFKGKDGSQRDETCFVDIKAWGRQAEVLNQYMSKGRPIFIEGRLEQSRWETKDGQKRSKIRVVVEQFQFLGSRSDEKGGGRSNSYEKSASNNAPPAAASNEMDDYSDEPPF